ncbi:MAG TPA: hypothetical protein VEA16_02540, partial [Vicinamibacterales bacterium]|nr:hypothetical protein [Vicinamibacterales bacterium]
PFLPLAIVPALLIWQGPLETAVWLMVIAGLAITRLPSLPDVLGRPNRAPWLAAAIVAISALAVFTQVRGVIPGGDEPHYLAATQSLLSDGDLRVANNYERGDYLQYFPGRLEPHFLTRSTGGEIYSVHAPGVSVVVLPAFALAGYPGAVATIIAIAALTASLAWRLAFRLSKSAAAAWVGVTAVFATTPYFFHTFTIYPEVIGGACVLCGVWLLFELADGRDVGIATLAAIGSALAMLPWLHSRFAVLAGVLGLLIVMRLFGRPRAIVSIAAFASVPLVAAAGWLTFFYVIWGSPTPTAPYGVDTSTSASYVLRGLIGLLFDQQFGLIFTAPIYATTIWGIVVLFRQQPRLTIELLLVVVPYAIAVASYAMWWAGSAAPARFLVAVLPLAALPIAALWKQHRTVFVAMLLAASVGLLLPRALVESGRFIFNNRGAVDGTLAWLSQIVDLPSVLPSVHRDGGLQAVRDAAVWLALFVVAGSAASRVTRSVSLAWTASAIAVAAAAMLAISFVGRVHAVTMLTPDRSKLSAFAVYRPGLHNVLRDLDAGQSLTQAGVFDAIDIDVTAPAVRLNRVPAGEYEVRVTAAPASPGPLAMFIGRNDPPIEAPQLRELHQRHSPFLLRLPVSVQTLNLMANEDVGAGLPWLTLRPVRRTTPAHGRHALRAIRYGGARAFFFDDWAYPERDGFWTRAGGKAIVVIDADDGHSPSGLPLSITAGAVPTSVRLSTTQWEELLTLDAGQKQDVVLPAAGGHRWTLTIQSGAGFRPSAREPGNRDVRELAAWIALAR